MGLMDTIKGLFGKAKDTAADAADMAGDVAGIAQKFGQRRSILRDWKPPRHAVFPKSLCILPHDQAAPARATWRIGDVGRREPNALGC